MADVTKITSGSLIAAEKVNGTDVYNMDGDKLGHASTTSCSTRSAARRSTP